MRWFTSDLHLGHRLTTKDRGFNTIKEHDEAVIASFCDLPRKGKLWILGDIGFRIESMELLRAIPCRNIVMVFGNHDTFDLGVYNKYFADIRGVQKYNKMWLSHIPVHPQELYRVVGNIHGHIHKCAATKPLEDKRYFNVNWDFHLGPVPFETIEEQFNGC